MKDLMGASLITAISSLLGGGLGGLAMAQERKYKMKMAKLLEGKLKPEEKYYMSPNLAGYDEALRKIIMGNIASKFGGDMLAKWGLGG